MLRREVIAAATVMSLLGGRVRAQTQRAPLRVAIKGYDPVAYFTEKQAVKGTVDFTYDWDGLRYQFATRAHRDAFAADPDKYAPQYSGYCAAAMSRGLKIEADPENWAISGGRLFVFATVVLPERWAAVHTELITDADRHWSEAKSSAR